MNSPSSNATLEEGLQRAHLLMLHGRCGEAELLLTSLAAAYPGSTEVAELMSRVQGQNGGSRPAKAGWWAAAFTRDYPGAMAYPLLLGIGCLALGVFMAARALPLAVTRGLSGTMQIEGKYRMISVPIAGQFTRATILLAVAGVCFAAASVVAKRARAPR